MAGKRQTPASSSQAVVTRELRSTKRKNGDKFEQSGDSQNASQPAEVTPENTEILVLNASQNIFSPDVNRWLGMPVKESYEVHLDEFKTAVMTARGPKADDCEDDDDDDETVFEEEVGKSYATLETMSQGESNGYINETTESEYMENDQVQSEEDDLEGIERELSKDNQNVDSRDIDMRTVDSQEDAAGPYNAPDAIELDRVGIEGNATEQGSTEATSSSRTAKAGTKVAKKSQTKATMTSPLTVLVKEQAKSMMESWNLTPKRGPHKRTPNVIVMPVFSETLVQALDEGDKKKVGALTNRIIQEITNDMCSKKSGYPGYYSQLTTGLLLRYPSLNNALLRNNIRRRLRKTVSLQELSEDSDEEAALQPTPGRPKRTFTNNANCLDLAKTLLSSTTRTERKALIRARVIEKAEEVLEQDVYSRIFDERRSRKSVVYPVDKSSYQYNTRIRLVEVDGDDEVDYAEAFRQTFAVRSRAIRGNGREIGDILNVYPLLRLKKYLHIEAQMYLGSAEKMQKYLDNVKITWDAIGKLQPGKTAEENFKDVLCRLGPSAVRFVDKELQPGSPESYKWPFVVQTPTQTYIQYDGNQWIDFEDLREGLAYLVLIISLFDMPETGRPQLYLLLEALFYGYLPKALKPASVIIMTQLKELNNSG